MTVEVKGGGPLWLKLRDLADGVTYTFRIRARTFTYGPEVQANITTGPGEGSGLGSPRPGPHPLLLNRGLHLAGAPGPPGEPFVTRYGTALTIHWSSGEAGRAPITRYVIEARPSGA